MATVRIITGDGCRFSVEGRTAVLIRWLAEHQTRLNRVLKGHLHVDVAGPVMTPTISDQYEPLRSN